MNAAEYVQALTERGVQLWVEDDGGLGFKAPRGVMTPAVKENLTKAKPRIIAYLRSVVTAEPPPTPKRRTEADIRPAPKAAPDTGKDIGLTIPDAAELEAVEAVAEEESETSFVTQLLLSPAAKLAQAWKGSLADHEYRFAMLAMYHAATFGVLPTLPDDAPLTLRPGTTVADLSRFVELSVKRSLDCRGKLKHPYLADVARERILDDLSIISLDMDHVCAYLSGWKMQEIEP